MNEEMLEMLVDSYGLKYLLELCDYETSSVLKLLIEQGEIDQKDLEVLL